jgi:hypothetical protein
MDLKADFGSVYLPFALERKYKHAERSWAWQYTFPATKPSIDPGTRIERRHHIAESVIQWAIKQAIRNAGIAKTGNYHKDCLKKTNCPGTSFGEPDLSNYAIFTKISKKGPDYRKIHRTGKKNITILNRDPFNSFSVRGFLYLHINNSYANGELDQLGNIFHLEFFHDFCPMGFYGAGADA